MAFGFFKLKALSRHLLHCNGSRFSFRCRKKIFKVDYVHFNSDSLINQIKKIKIRTTILSKSIESSSKQLEKERLDPIQINFSVSKSVIWKIIKCCKLQNARLFWRMGIQLNRFTQFHGEALALI